jgi:hypothetical protein
MNGGKEDSLGCDEVRRPPSADALLGDVEALEELAIEG